ncbi:MAG: polysaccharide biosynthesis C-terminal domain-containing protein, partial [Acidimicrobiales bacterium]
YLATAILQSRGRPAVASRWYLGAAVLAGVTLLAFMPLFGLIGAALSSCVTYLAVGAGLARASAAPTALPPRGPLDPLASLPDG